MDEIMNKLRLLSEKVEKKDLELTALRVKYDSKRHELYGKRNAGENVDEEFIKNLELMNDELNEYFADFVKKLSVIDESINGLEEYIDELHLDEFHTNLNS